ncbi:MAG: ZIP family metal transporter [Promethearchaeota archaeon]
MIEVYLAFLTIFLIGCLSLIGIVMISLREKTLDKLLLILVAFGTGAILATALFSLIPEAIHHMEELRSEGVNFNENFLFLYIISGFIIFFFIERFIYWFHGHGHESEDKLVCYSNKSGMADELMEKGGKIKSYVYLNLLGDGLHNFLDGVVIIVAFLTGIGYGIVVSLAVLFHELPQEVGDYGILVYGGFTKKKALEYNFLSAMVAMLGGVIGYILSSQVRVFNIFILAFSGGGFLYIACTELMPEFTKQKNLKKSILQALIFLIGLLLIIVLVIVLPHE